MRNTFCWSHREIEPKSTKEMTCKISDENFTGNDLESKDQNFGEHDHSALTYFYTIHEPPLLSPSLDNVEKNSIEFPAPAEPSTPDVPSNDYPMSDTWEVETAYLTEMDYEPEDDDLWIYEPDSAIENKLVFGVYKPVDKKVRPVPTTFPKECQVTRQIPEDPMLTLPPLPHHPPIFSPTPKISVERMKILNVNAKGFLWPEEEKLFQHIMVLNEDGIAFEDIERGTLKDSYFSPYIIPTVPHTPWQHRNRPVPPGIADEVIKVLKLKMDAGVYEHSQSSSIIFTGPRSPARVRQSPAD